VGGERRLSDVASPLNLVSSGGTRLSLLRPELAFSFGAAIAMPSTISIAAIARRQRPLSVAELVELSRDPAKIQAIETAFNDRLSACQEAEKRLSAQHTSDVAEFESREVKLAEAQTALDSAHGLLDAREATLDAREANIAERAAAQNVVAQNLARREDEVAKREAALDQRDTRYRELVAVLQPSQ